MENKIFVKYKKPAYFLNKKVVIDKFIINKFMSGDSYDLIARDINLHYDNGYDANTVKRVVSKVMQDFNVWSSREICSRYLVLNIYSFWIDAPNYPRFKKKRIDIVSGINIYGKFEYISFYIYTNHSENYWTHVIEDLIKRGLTRVDLLFSNFNHDIKSIIRRWFPNNYELVDKYMPNGYINEICSLDSALNKSKKFKSQTDFRIHDVDILQSIDELHKHLNFINDVTNNKFISHTTNLIREFKAIKIYELGKNLKTVFFMHMYFYLINRDLKKVQDSWRQDTPFDYDRNIQKCLFLLIEGQNHNLDMKQFISLDELENELKLISSVILIE